MTRGRWVVLIVVVAVLAASALVSLAIVGRSGSSGPRPLPRSMASAGDSITRAFDVDAGHFLRDDPEASWASGSAPAVGSHYDRILAALPAMAGHAYNDAQSGAPMAALAGQLQMAAAQRVEYVTVLMGANDLCTPTAAAMTSTATFSAQFDTALSRLFAGDPGARVFVSSIPDLFRLWDALRTNTVAEITWTLAHICQSMLSVSATAAGRQQVVAQEQADNAALDAVCRRYAHCRFDGGAAYRATFTAADISPVDYFHPSLAGQTKLAALSWAAGFWPSTR